MFVAEYKKDESNNNTNASELRREGNATLLFKILRH